MLIRHGAARTMDALDFECAALSREFHATADALNEGLPLPAVRQSFEEMRIVAQRIAILAAAQVVAIDDHVLLEAAE